MTAGPALEMWSRQSGTASTSDGRTASITMQRAFTITMAVTDPLEVLYQASGLPLVGDLYPNTNYVVCQNLAPQRLSPILGMVVATYKGDVGPNGISDSPINNEVIVDWSNTVTDEEIDTDWDGKPIVTKNDEPIYGITERISDQVLTVERNFISINMYAIRAYLRATNSDTFADWPPGTARMMQYRASRRFNSGPAFWRVSATFQFREPYQTEADKAWYKRVRHEGLLVRDAADETPHIAWDEGSKTPVTTPILLKEDGTREDDPENAFWLEFQTLGTLPFGALGLL